MVVTQSLVESKKGIHLGSEAARQISTRERTLIVQQRFYKNQVNRLLYVLDDEKCYGIIKLKQPQKISVSEFNARFEEHKLTNEYRQKHWPYKEVLFAYQFDIISMFTDPRDISLKDKSLFVSEFEFTSSKEQPIEDINSYDATKKSPKALVDDFKIVSAWHTNKLCGGHVKYSIDEIKALAKNILTEIKRRVEKGDMSFEFDKEKKKTKTMSIDAFEPVAYERRFDNLYKTVEYMFTHGNKFILEKKLEGDRMMVVKDGSDVHIYAENKKDITEDHKDLAVETGLLSDTNFAIDCVMSADTLYVTDCLFNDGDISCLPLAERKSIIHSFNFQGHVKEIPTIVVDSQDDAKKGLTLLKNIPNSSGAVIKTYNGQYSNDSAHWVALSKGDDKDV
jgi:hypothetical protein